MPAVRPFLMPATLPSGLPPREPAFWPVSLPLTRPAEYPASWPLWYALCWAAARSDCDMPEPVCTVYAAMPTTIESMAASASASSSAAGLKRGSEVGSGFDEVDDMGPQTCLALDGESPAQRRDPLQRLLTAQQHQALEQAGGHGAPRDGHSHRPEQHPRLEAGLLAGAAQRLLDRSRIPLRHAPQRLRGGLQGAGRIRVVEHSPDPLVVVDHRPEQEPGESLELAQHAQLVLHDRRHLGHALALGCQRRTAALQVGLQLLGEPVRLQQPQVLPVQPLQLG